MSHANGLSPFRGKINRFIIPVSHFKGHTPGVKAPKQSSVAEPSAQYNQIKEEQPIKKTEEKTQATPLPKINIEKAALGNGVSSFSLSSIQLKKEAKQKSSSKKNIVNDIENLWEVDNYLQENRIDVFEKLDDIKKIDVYVILTEWEEFNLINSKESIVIFDGRNINQNKNKFSIGK